MHSHIDVCTNFDNAVFIATETSLNEWTSEENLKLPSLIEMVSLHMKLSIDSISEIDPIVRRYVRTHPDWRVSRGVKGGITRKSVWEKKQAEKTALDAAKKEVVAQVNTKIKNGKSTPATVDVVADSNADKDLSF